MQNTRYVITPPSPRSPAAAYWPPPRHRPPAPWYAPNRNAVTALPRPARTTVQRPSSACSGSAKQDNLKDAWIYVPKGTCQKVAGGTLAQSDTKKK